MTNIIKNSNGREYTILDSKKEYTLLIDNKFSFNGLKEFVVAYGLKEYEEGYSWLSGTYFYDNMDATEYFVRKTM